MATPASFLTLRQARPAAVLWLGVAAGLVCLGAVPPASAADEGRQYFENKVRPLLVAHCYECHSAKAKELGGKLRLDSRAGILEGGESGPALIPGKPGESLLIDALRREDEHRMPPDEPLPDALIHDLVGWVEMGAPDPRTDAPPDPSQKDPSDESLWAFRPLQDPPLPGLRDPGWALDPLDHFILARIENAGLAPAADARPEALIRRLHYDLTGLPPEAEEVEAFVADHARDGRAATALLVDRLLASPRFGERWGRYWLDVARFGESNGNDGLGRNPTFPHAWRYRDYVIRALNDDVPYDRFLTEQIAGDLLPADSAEQRNRQLVATGFLAIGAKPAAAMNENFAMDVVDDQINAVCTGVIGLSVSCARCHDHKHDPIPTRDYYALAGIFKSTETLWGKAGNEALTAPATPLHELRADLQPPAPPAAEAAPPAFADGYSAAIDALKPAVHARLDAEPDGLVIEKGIQVSAEAFATLKDGRMRADVAIPADSYSIAFWFRNDLDNQAQPITAYLFSLAADGDTQQVGDHLGLGGKHDPALTGMLYVWNGQGGDPTVGGRSLIAEKTWNHVVLVREGRRLQVFLNGNTEPEIDAEIAAVAPENRKVFIGARNDHFAPLDGAMAEVAVFDRALTADEAKLLHSASGQPVKQLRRAVADFAMGAREAGKIEDCKINIDGDSKKLGPPVPRGFLSACALEPAPPAPDAQQSGRLQLAEWLTRPDHPQTARVMVNRLWLHLFGEGIVATPDDFGVYGARPSHPGLLDHLATRFAADGWSTKRMIRAIVLSRSYQLASDGPGQAALFSPHLRRRLDAESLRDSILQASGELDLEPAQGSAVGRIDQLINWPPGEAVYLHEASQHRSVYLCMLRNSPPPELAPFNFPKGVAVAGKRDVTILPGQALFLMNSPFVVGQAEALAAKLLQPEVAADAASRVRAAYRAVLKRDPTAPELARGLAHIEAMEQDLPAVNAWASFCQVLLASNEFRYID